MGENHSMSSRMFRMAVALIVAVTMGTVNLVGSTPVAVAASSIDIKKEVSVDNGATWLDANSATGPSVIAGANWVRFRYTVTNTGDVTLANIVVTDTGATVPTGSIPATLAVAGSFQINVGPVKAANGQYSSTATVKANAQGATPLNVPSSSNDKYQFVFVFVNGTTVTGGTDDKDASLAGFGGPVLSDTVHLSCSDHFGFDSPTDGDPDGWAEKDAPEFGNPTDANWQIAGYKIAEYKDGSIDKQCGGGDTTPKVTDTDNAFYIGIDTPPAIDIEKLVRVNNGTWFDADSPTGPQALAGVDTVSFRFIVTNTGGSDLTNVVISELSNNDTGYTLNFGPANAAVPNPFLIGASYQFDLGPFTAEARQHFNEAKVVGTEVAPPAFSAASWFNQYDLSYAFRFILADGTIIDGTSDGNSPLVPSNDPNESVVTVTPNQTFSTFFHVSCSDDFGFGNSEPDGWGEKGAPVFGVDNGPIVAYAIFKSGNPAAPDCSYGSITPNPQTVTDNDPANYLGVLPASIGDRVWTDTNRNGIQDNGEPGVDGVTVQLLNAQGTVVTSKTTAGGGLYLFDKLVPGTYSIRFVLPTGKVFTLADVGNDALDSDANQTTGQTIQTVLSAGENDLTWDAGLVVPFASLGDFVWSDLNGNGVQDAGEPGIPGVTVKLDPGTPANPADDLTTTTNASGAYLFPNLLPGDYTVAFTTPSGFVTSPANQGGDDAKDSDPVNGSVAVNLSPNENDLTIDAGFVPVASLGDFVWSDLNANGIQDPGEPGIPGVTVTLDPNTPGTPGDDVVKTTDANGAYLFPNLVPGTYRVVFTTPSGHVTSPANQGGDDAKDSDPVAGVVTEVLTPGENNLTIDAGFVPFGSLGDFVWSDLNANGIQDAGEPGIAGVTVTLDPNTPSNPADDVTKTTDANGAYLFPNLQAGTYRVVFTTPSGFVTSPSNQGGDDAKDSDPIAGVVTEVLTAGENNLTIDAGFVPLASLGDFVWSDLNGNGVQDPGEPGIAGVMVRLDPNTPSDPSDDVAKTTDANGAYLFPNLQPGAYRVVFTTPSGFVTSPSNQGGDDTKDSDPVSGVVFEVLTAGENNLTIDAGFVPLASLGDFVWSDLNGNGVQDPGEPGIPGVTITLDPNTPADPTDDVIKTTDANGAYLFPNLQAGAYRVVFTTPSGFVTSPSNQGGDDTKDSDPISGVVFEVLTAGENNLTIDAGFVPLLGSLGDFVWFDTDRDGVQDAGEAGIAGVTVKLDPGTPANPADDLTTTTNANGAYSFQNLSAGNYTVSFTTPAGMTVSPSNQGGDDAKDSDPVAGSVTVALAAGENNPTIDAGFMPLLGSLGDFVWSDTDRDGVQDPGEAGIAGVTVKLDPGTPANPADDLTTTTNANGAYLFSNLPAGNYTVSFTTPAGTTASPANQGGDDTKDSDPVNGSVTVALTAGQSNLTVDAGFMPLLGSLGDFVWFDTDRDGVQDAGEAGIAGVTVKLDPGTPANPADDVTTTTNANGGYSFTNLPAGNYTVSFTTPAGMTVSPSNQGADDTKDSDPVAGSVTVTLAAGEHNPTIDAGFMPLLGSLGDFVWSDTDRDGVQDPGEPGIPGVTVTLDPGTPANPADDLTTTTNANGAYLFSNLPAGNYTVSFTTPAGTTASPANQGGDDTKDSDPVDGSVTVALTAGQSNLTVDAGFMPLLGFVG